MTPETPDGEKLEHGGWLTRFVRARRNELVSLVLAGSGLFVLVSVLTFNPLDPSLNVARDAAPTNAFGHRGAIVADLTLQWLGWAGAALAVMVFAWGVVLLWRGPRQRGPKIVLLRLLACALATGGLATAAASLPVPVTWDFATGLGGAVGDLIHGEIASWLGALGAPAAGGVAGFIALTIALIGMVAGYGVTPADIADAFDSGRRLAQRSGRTARRLAERYVQGLDEEVVRLEPVAPRAALASAYEEDLRETRERRAAPPPQPARREPAEERVAQRAEDDDDLFSPIAAAPRDRLPSPRAEAEPPIAPPPPTPKRTPREPSQAGLFGEDEDAFVLPDANLLATAPPRVREGDEGELDERAEALENVLLDFSIKGKVVDVRPGPVVTLFEFEPAPGVRSSRVINLADDIARSLSAQSARVAVVPGRNVIGIELPNVGRETVFLSELMESGPYNDRKVTLPLGLGVTIGGEPWIADLAKMPHLLIAGTTGSGKSVGINAMILSLMYKLTPERCRFIMIDPKMLELSVYDGIPHLLSPVVTDPKKAVTALKWVVREMEARYRRMAKLKVRNIQGYNRRVEEALKRGERLERQVQTGYDQETGKPVFETERMNAVAMPYIVVVIDEMADLMLVAGREIETLVQRIAQMARAAGIHLIMATQRPSVDVITGTIRANFPTRMSYRVTTRVDSRIIIGEQGAEQLLGQGDLLLMAEGGRIRRLHGPFVSDEEVDRVAAFFKSQGAPEYVDAVTEDFDEDDDGDGPDNGGGAARREATGDELYDRAIEIIATSQRASTSYLQRQLNVGYNRAATLIERMERDGIVSAPNNSKKREVLIPPPDEPDDSDVDHVGDDPDGELDDLVGMERTLN